MCPCITWVITITLLIRFQQKNKSANDCFSFLGKQRAMIMSLNIDWLQTISNLCVVFVLGIISESHVTWQGKHVICRWYVTIMFRRTREAWKRSLTPDIWTRFYTGLSGSALQVCWGLSQHALSTKQENSALVRL